ncbi:glutamate receptor ionotropic, kainate 2-like [Diachasma alloeum]|uniref:Ionotropic receptor 106 n=1 Tax=Diachasma alloeum TaxID=454923 RepID=A0A4E0RQG2_9HYME|nr:glutamate receptor ionotropic, kainate 2-like [Diachasma alloeum]THK33024.1 ionotropic receptor 106 [Diachasma alloeum]
MQFFIFLILLCTSSVIIVKLNEAHFYGPAIKAVHDKFEANGVAITAGINHLSFEQLTVWHETSRFLSNEGISTLIVSFQQLRDIWKTQPTYTTSSLIVIAFETFEELHTFELIIKTFHMNYAVWLIFFMRDADREVCHFCRNPHGTIANLKFGTRILISCCDSNMIEEWWSIGENLPKRQEIGRLMDENFTISWFSDELMNGDKYSLKGASLRITAVTQSVFFRKKDGQIYGFLAEYLKELSRAMDFKVSEIIWEEDFGVCITGSSDCTGSIGRVQREEVDLGVAAFSATVERHNLVDFTLPIITGNYEIYFSKYDVINVRWNAYFKPFAADVWIVIICSILMTAIFFTLIRYKRESPFFPLFADHYLHMWGILCHQSVPAFPREAPLRIVYLTMALSALVISSTYAASLTSTLTLSLYSPFNTVEEFVEDGTYELIVLDSALINDMYKFSDKKLKKKMLSLLRSEDSLPKSPQEAFEEVCRTRVAFFTHEATKKALFDLIPCEISFIRINITNPMSMITPRGSKYTEIINHHICQFKEVGLLRRLENKYFIKMENDQTVHAPISLQAVKSIFMILVTGCLLASIIFIIELKLYTYCKNLCDQRRRKTLLGKRGKFPFSMYNFVIRKFP